ncbi:hypothetical protein K8I61_04870 [bacterium]|nr:hypothetical protein [bacterium]
MPAAQFVAQFPLRAIYPGHLEIMEGQMLLQAWRVATGEPLYVEPSLSAIAPPYFPLWFHAVALLMRVIGEPAWWTGRLVSFLSALGVGALFFAFGKREGRGRIAGAVAAGLFFATYGLTGAYWDLARVDSLPLALGFAAFVLPVLRPTWISAVAAGALMALSVLGKQTQIAFIPVLVFAFLPSSLWRGIVAALIASALSAIAVFAINDASDGWMWKYTIDMVAHHHIRAERYSLFALWLAKHFGVHLALIAAYLVTRLARRAWREIFGEPWFYFIGAGVILAVAIWRIDGAYHNSLIPAAMAMVAGAVVFGARLAREYAHQLPQTNAARAILATMVVAVMLVMGGYPFALGHPLWKQVPTRSMRHAVKRLNATVAAYPGTVYMPFHTLLSNPNRHLPHNVPLRDLAASPWGRTHHRRLMRELRDLKIDAFLTKSRRHQPARFLPILAGMKREKMPKRLMAKTGPLTGWPDALYERPESAGTMAKTHRETRKNRRR